MPLRKLRNLILIIMTLELASCASNPVVKTQNTEPRRHVVVQRFEVGRGQALQIRIPVIEGFETSKIFCADKEIIVARREGYSVGFYAESYFSDLSSKRCYAHNSADDALLVALIGVKEVEYASEKLNVDPSRVHLSKANQERVKREQEMLDRIHADRSQHAFFESAFARPLKSFITSDYGVQRVFNGDHKAQHLGTDFRAAKGTKIPAANNGKVVFTGDLFYSGYTVIIDHGLGIFTNYGHMSSFLVKVGDRVKRGDIVGLSGSTGRSTAPHLHWGVRIHGDDVDGLTLIEQSQDW